MTKHDKSAAAIQAASGCERCHLASSCDDCCKTCISPCNSSQTCIKDSSASEVAAKCTNTGCLQFNTAASDHCMMAPDGREINGFTSVADCGFFIGSDDALAAARKRRSEIIEKQKGKSTAPEVPHVTIDQVGSDHDDEAEQICINTECPEYSAEESNGCTENCNVYECEKVIYSTADQETTHAATSEEAATEGMEAAAGDNNGAADAGADETVAEEVPEQVPFIEREPDKISRLFTKPLPVPIEDHKKAEYADELARLQVLWVDTKLDAKAYAKAAKEIIDEAEEKLLDLAQKVKAGTEEQQVPCRTEFDYREGVKRVLRMDNWMIVEERPLSLEERQMSFDLEESEGSVEQLREVQAENAAELAEKPGMVSICAGCFGDCEADETGLGPHPTRATCTGHRAHLSQKQVNHRDNICREGWEGCEYQHKCFGPANEEGDDGPCLCLADEAKKQEPLNPLCAICHTQSECPECCKTCEEKCQNEMDCMRDDAEEDLAQAAQETALTFAELLDLGYSRNAAKILLAGFSLVRYDREAKCINTSAPDLRDDWFMFDPFSTYAAAERALKEMLEDPGVIQIGMDVRGLVCGNQKHLAAKEFNFFRLFNERKQFGADEPCRIKAGPNWTTWKKFDEPEECLEAWEKLLNEDMNALED